MKLAAKLLAVTLCCAATMTVASPAPASTLNIVRTSSTRNQRVDALKAIGAMQTGQMRAEPGNPKSPKRRLWIIRNLDRWKNATEAQIIAHWKGI